MCPDQPIPLGRGSSCHVLALSLVRSCVPPLGAIKSPLGARTMWPTWRLSPTTPLHGKLLQSPGSVPGTTTKPRPIPMDLSNGLAKGADCPTTCTFLTRAASLASMLYVVNPRYPAAVPTWTGWSGRPSIQAKSRPSDPRVARTACGQELPLVTPWIGPCIESDSRQPELSWTEFTCAQKCSARFCWPCTGNSRVLKCCASLAAKTKAGLDQHSAFGPCPTTKSKLTLNVVNAVLV